MNGPDSEVSALMRRHRVGPWSGHGAGASAAGGVPGRRRSVRQPLLADLCRWLDGLSLAQEQGKLLQVISEWNASVRW